MTRSGRWATDGRNFGSVFTAVLIFVAASGCTGALEPIQVTPTSAVTEAAAPATMPPETALESILRIAIEDDAHPDQIAALERAIARGDVPFDDVRAAVDATYACLADAGIGYVEEPRDPDRPYGPIVFSIRLATSADDALSDACVFGHSFYLQSAYEQQPAAQEQHDAEFERARPVMIACLVEHGVEVDESVTTAELKDLLIYAETGIDRRGDATPPASWEPWGCLQRGGLTGF